jgi:hypothetical protein
VKNLVVEILRYAQNDKVTCLTATWYKNQAKMAEQASGAGAGRVSRTHPDGRGSKFLADRFKPIAPGCFLV